MLGSPHSPLITMVSMVRDKLSNKENIEFHTVNPGEVNPSQALTLYKPCKVFIYEMHIDRNSWK